MRRNCCIIGVCAFVLVSVWLIKNQLCPRLSGGRRGVANCTEVGGLAQPKLANQEVKPIYIALAGIPD
jgi:hypothetical protein